jgi:ABC-type transport system involved in multi-copper enzyme maturation permease subunit
MDSPVKSNRFPWDIVLGLLLALAGPLAAWYLSRTVPLAFLILAAGVWLALVGICWRRPLLRLAGPLFLYEIIRETRRSRYFLLRIYCYLILFVLTMAALVWSINGTSLELSVAEAADVAQTIAVMLLCAHLFLVTFVVPVYVGGAVSEDKERRTLEYLMATELGSNEILLGKLGVRQANLVLMLLTGLPVLALLQLVGGLDADLVLGGFAATVAYTFSLSCLALFNSVRSRRTRDAIMRTFFMVVGYLIGSWAFLGFLHFLAELWLPRPVGFPRGFFPGPPPNQPIWLADFFDNLDYLGAGNPFLVTRFLDRKIAAGSTPNQAFVFVLLLFMAFHLLLGLALLALAMLSFRRVFQEEQEIITPVAPARKMRRWRDFGNHPLFWKEIWIEGARKRGCLGVLGTGALVLGSFIPAWQLYVSEPPPVTVRANVQDTEEETLKQKRQHEERLKIRYTDYALTTSGLVLCLFLLRVAIQASSTFSRERERQTLESLLACPVTPEQVMYAKWGGAMLSIRLGWLWLAAVWLIGVQYGRVPWLTLVFLLGAWLIYAGAIASLAQWFSMVARSSTRALVFTVSTLAVLFTGSIALSFNPRVIGTVSAESSSLREWIFRFEICMSPAYALGRLIPDATAGTAFDGTRADSWEGPMVNLGVLTWLAGGIYFWRRTLRLVSLQMCPERARGYPALKGIGGAPVGANSG